VFELPCTRAGTESVRTISSNVSRQSPSSSSSLRMDPEFGTFNAGEETASQTSHTVTSRRKLQKDNQTSRSRVSTQDISSSSTTNPSRHVSVVSTPNAFATQVVTSIRRSLNKRRLVDSDDDEDYEYSTDDSNDGDFQLSKSRRTTTRSRVNKRFRSSHSDITGESPLSSPEPEPQPGHRAAHGSQAVGRRLSKDDRGRVACINADKGCKKKFGRVHDMKRHLKSNACNPIKVTKEKPFRCACGKSAFDRQDALNRHVNNSKKSICAPILLP
jgi:hypothetical protein